LSARGRRLAPLVAWTALLGATAAVLHLAGPALPGPPLGSPSRWNDWFTGRDPVVVAFSLLRLVALGFAWYALAVTVGGGLARLVAAKDLAAGLDRLTLPPLRRVLAATMSVGIGTASLGPSAGAAARPAAAVTFAQGSTTTTTAVTEPPVDSLTMQELPLADEAGPVEPAVEPAAERTWTVRPGECFWSIAEDVLASTFGRRPTAAEVVPYWRSLIETNRTGLADPENADLVFPGQVFTVPDPS
jgi:hypothetical protein